MDRSRALLVRASLLILFAALLGCVSRNTFKVSSAADVPDSQARSTPVPAIPPADHVEEVLLAARAHEAAGARALEGGNRDLAREEFDHGLRILENARPDERLDGPVEDLRSRIQSLSVASTVPIEEIEEVPEEAEPSPMDELAETNPELPEAEISQERSLIESAPPAFDFPMTVNEKVVSWVSFYSTRHREKFLPGLIRSGKYLSMIQRIFGEEGLPKDLAYMGQVESAFKVHAYSRAKAKGLFQFIAATGRRYGLRNDYWVDERSDPEKATRAAARYLKDLYAMFGDWYLALAGYNAGEGKIQRGMARTGEKDFWGLASRKGTLRAETRNYVPAILAATLIYKEPKKYGFDFEAEPAIAYDTIQVTGPVDLRVLARCAGSDYETLKELNPALRRGQTPPTGEYGVRVPVGRGAGTLAALQEIPARERVTQLRHRVRRGENLAGIARRYGVTTALIQQANGIGRRVSLRAGEMLTIPGGGLGAPVPSASRGTQPSQGGVVVYRVQRGDTLAAIGRRYGTSPEAIASRNGISVSKPLQIGKKLSIPAGRSTAGGKPASGSPLIHMVKQGDTLHRIADRYRITVNQLCAINRISRNETLYPGTRLTIRAE